MPTRMLNKGFGMKGLATNSHAGHLLDDRTSMSCCRPHAGSTARRSRSGRGLLMVRELDGIPISACAPRRRKIIRIPALAVEIAA